MTVLTEMAIRIDLTDIHPFIFLFIAKRRLSLFLLLFLFLNFLFYDLTKVLPIRYEKLCKSAQRPESSEGLFYLLTKQARIKGTLISRSIILRLLHVLSR